MDADDILSISPKAPSSQAHKYSRGTLLVCAGSEAYPGAACLCAWASQYMGAGYTHVFTAKANKQTVQLVRPSLVVSDFETCDFTQKYSDNHPLACTIGPGFDKQDHVARELLLQAVSEFSGPLVIDGGALRFAAEPHTAKLIQNRASKGYATILTPHRGEALCLRASLATQSLEDTHDKQKRWAQILARMYKATVVLKGSNTVIADHKQSTCITRGASCLAKAGTGDVLAGIIGALVAQGMESFSAAALGVCLHADAGTYAMQTYGIISVCAEEVVKALPQAIMAAQEKPYELMLERNE